MSSVVIENGLVIDNVDNVLCYAGMECCQNNDSRGNRLLSYYEKINKLNKGGSMNNKKKHGKINTSYNEKYCIAGFMEHNGNLICHDEVIVDELFTAMRMIESYIRDGYAEVGIAKCKSDSSK